MKKIRIQKYLSNQGILSRRKAEFFLLKGLIKVNGRIIMDPGTKIDPGRDIIELANEIDYLKSKYKYLAFHKPRGIVTNCPQNKEVSIKDILPKQYQHLSAIGRLDKDSEGLIILTDDGVYTNKMLDSENPHKRIYEVWLNNPLTISQQNKIESGLKLFGQKTKPLSIQNITNKHIKLIMYEGKNRQIRRILKKVGIEVQRLIRIQFGDIKLGSLPAGKFRKIVV